MSKLGVRQSALCYNVYHCKTNKYVNTKAYRNSTQAKMKDKNTKIHHSISYEF